MNLMEANWMDVEQALTTVKLAVIPVGAVENYGPHLPLGTETTITEAIARKLGEKVDAIVIPVIPVSCSQGHQSFPGTLSVTQATLKAYVKGICDSLIEKGIGKLLFIDGHGGNVMVIDELCQEYMEAGIDCAQIDLWRFVFRVCPDQATKGQSATGHAGETATSMMLALRGELVNKDKFRHTPSQESQAAGFPEIKQYYPMRTRFQTGAGGDPTNASGSEGEGIINRCLARLEQFVREWG